MSAPHGSTTVAQALQEIADGGMVVVADDVDRLNEGDLLMAAEHVTPADVVFLERHTSGVVCVALTGERCDELDLPLMVAAGTEQRRTAFTHTVDLAGGTTTGISATDRSATIAALAGGSATAACFRRPGHVFPLRAREGGVLTRAGHTEAAVDLARMAGLRPAGVLCEIVDDDGSTARRTDPRPFAARHGLPMIAIADLVAYRRRSGSAVERTGHEPVPTPWGDFRCVGYRSFSDGAEHVAFTMGDLSAPGDVPVRVHRECRAGTGLRGLRCDCGSRLETAMGRVAAGGRGVVVFLRGRDTGPGAGVGAQILADLGVRAVDDDVAVRGGQVVAREQRPAAPHTDLGRLCSTRRRLDRLLDGAATPTDRSEVPKAR